MIDIFGLPPTQQSYMHPCALIVGHLMVHPTGWLKNNFKPRSGRNWVIKRCHEDGFQLYPTCRAALEAFMLQAMKEVVG